MSWPVHSSTKASNVEWLGVVPSHWDVRQLKWGSPVRRGASPRPIDDPKYFDDEGDWSWVRIADVSASDGLLAETTQRLSQLGSSLSVKLNPGSLFVSIAGTVGKPCITTIPACIHDGFVYFPSLDLNPQFLFRIFESGECYKGLGKFGTQLNLNTDTIGSIRMPIPPLPEQEAIANFLDRETAKIDALIAKQEQLIATLREDRTATITHAVTKGLNPDVEMKDSGVEWVGQIPAHWTIPQIGMHTAIGNGSTPSRENPSYWNDGAVPWLNSSHVNYEAITEADQFVTELARRECHLPLVAPGSVLVGLTGQGKTRGMASVLLTPSTINQHLAYLTPTGDQLNGLFLQRVLSSAYQLLRDISDENGSTKGGLTCTALRKVRIPLPPLHEQRKIIEFLGMQCRKIDILVTKADEVINTLREYRSALITDAVTGKIDVRGAA